MKNRFYVNLSLPTKLANKMLDSVHKHLQLQNSSNKADLQKNDVEFTVQ